MIVPPAPARKISKIIREGEGTAIKLLKLLNVDLMELRKTIEQSIGTGTHKVSNLANIPLVKQAERALKITYLEAKLFKSAIIGTEHLLLSILKDEDNVATKSLHKFKIDYEVMRNELELSKSDPKAEFPGTPPDDDDSDDNFGSASSTKKPGFHCREGGLVFAAVVVWLLQNHCWR